MSPTPENAYRCVIFDLDGTLLDTRDTLVETVNGLLRELDRGPVAAEQLAEAMHRGLGAMLYQALDETGPLPPTDRLQHLERCLRQRYWLAAPRGVRPYPGAEALLTALQTQGYWLAVCSNQDEASVHTLLDLFALRGYFREVVGGDTFVSRKPDPMPLRWLMTSAHCAPEDTLMVGDSALDAECAQRAGVAVVLMRHGYGGSGITAPHRDLADFAALQALLMPAGTHRESL